jgi:hypothetical protein
MADIFEAHRSNEDWFEKERKRKFALSDEGMRQSLMQAFSIDFATLIRHPKLLYTDDGSTHYVDTMGIHYVFRRPELRWSKGNRNLDHFDMHKVNGI